MIAEGRKIDRFHEVVKGAKKTLLRMRTNYSCYFANNNSYLNSVWLPNCILIHPSFSVFIPVHMVPCVMIDYRYNSYCFCYVILKELEKFKISDKGPNAANTCLCFQPRSQVFSFSDCSRNMQVNVLVKDIKIHEFGILKIIVVDGQTHLYSLNFIFSGNSILFPLIFFIKILSK